jgi:hypothetical protein
MHPVTGAHKFDDFPSTSNLVKVQWGPRFPDRYSQLSSNVSVEFDSGCITVGLDGVTACSGFVIKVALAADHGEFVS